MFADQGLRTLCCAVKEISSEVFGDWKQRHHAARCAADSALLPLHVGIVKTVLHWRVVVVLFQIVLVSLSVTIFLRRNDANV